MNSVEDLINTLSETHLFFQNQALRQVNAFLTMRNWLFGYYIVEYEQKGKDRAKYGKKLIDTISLKLKEKKLKGFSPVALRTNRLFYLSYPQIRQTLSVEFGDSYLHLNESVTINNSFENTKIDPYILVNRFSFSHFIEFLKIDIIDKRRFYESQVLKNNWSVRALQRAINSMLYERTGLSTNKDAVLKNPINGKIPKSDEVFRSPYILEFLGLKENSEYSETDLEQAIIDHLQEFLMEMGQGFCFEARQKRITFDNTHYRIDLVFYHRILKCHVLLDLKLGEFSHSDSGQMNVYLNYFRENEMQHDDNPPIGIILCAGKNENLVKYATAGLSHDIFVSKYLLQLPNEKELIKVMQKNRDKYGITFNNVANDNKTIFV